MGDTIQQWRATVGQWSGGTTRNCVTLQHHIAQSSDHLGYMQIRFLVLVSLLVIGCVELNPGPKHGTSASTQKAGDLSKLRRQPGSFSLHGELYGLRMAAFLFIRALNMTEEFQLASNVDGAGDFDDLVLRYRLRDSDVCKTCFIELKYTRNGGTIIPSNLTQMSGDFSLLKYFKSYCEIKKKAATNRNLKQCGRFDDFEFVIYTNENFESYSSLQGGESDSLSILSSGTDYGKYISFDETSDPDIFGFFEELSKYHTHIKELDRLFKRETSADKDIALKIQNFQSSICNKEILDKLDSLKLTLNQDCLISLINEVSKCDFTFYREFLSRVKIFQNQSNEEYLKEAIEKEIQVACKASPSVANFMYTVFEDGLYKWWKRDGKVVWLDQNSKLWQTVEKYITTKIKEMSESKIKDIYGCGMRFKQQHVQKLSDAIEQNTVLNIVTNSSICILQKLKIDQALNMLRDRNSSFIGIKSLMKTRNEFNKMWPCKWVDVLVVNCDSDGKVAHTVLDILQPSTNDEEGLGISDENAVKSLVDILQKYQQKLIVTSVRKTASEFQEKLRNISVYFEDDCAFPDLEEKSQKQILERPVNFQGTSVALSTLVGTDPTDSIKLLLNSDVISILLNNEHGLSVGRQSGDHCKYYVPRVLQHHVYLKEDILKLTDKTTTFAVSGLQSDELKKYVLAGEKIWQFVYDERKINNTFKIVYVFSNNVISAECGTITTHQNEGRKMFDDVWNKIFDNTVLEIDDSEGKVINSFSIVATLSKSDISTELVNIKYYSEAGQNIEPQEVRYIVLGNNNPESEFKRLKKLYSNIHWIHVEEGSFLWRDTSCNIDIIRTYIDNTRCKEYNMESVVEQKDRTMLLVAEPGMGKSIFLSHMAHEIKKRNPSVWILRINLNEHINELEGTDINHECIDSYKMFLWSAAHSPEQDALKFTKEIFLIALEQTGKLVIILDGYDEISPDYCPKVKAIISAIIDETASQIWISSRMSHQQDLEDVVGKFAFTLQPFGHENQIQFLEEYWSAVTGISNKRNLEAFAEQLLSFCSKNLSDKDGEFTGIPLQTMMLGEAFVNEAKEYCCSGEINLPGQFNLHSLFKTFTEKKFDIYFREKNKMDTSKPGVRSYKKDYEEKHIISALIYLFSPNEFNELSGAINSTKLEQTNWFLNGGKAEKFGIITGTMGGKPNFINRCFAQYFADKWFTDNSIGREEFIHKSFPTLRMK